MSNSPHEKNKNKLIILGEEKLPFLRECLNIIGDYEKPDETEEICLTENDRVIIVYSSYNPGSFFREFAKTQKLSLRSKIICIPYSDKSELPFKGRINKGNRKFVLNSNPKDTADSGDIIEFSLPPQALAALESIIVHVKDYDIEQALEDAKWNGDRDPIIKLRTDHTVALLSVWAFNMYLRVFEDIGHGGTLDFANTFLGPIAAGYNLPKPDQKTYFPDLLKKLNKKLKAGSSPIVKLQEAFSNSDFQECGSLYQNMKMHLDVIYKAIDETGEGIKEEDIYKLEYRKSVEALLFQTGYIREMAGIEETILPDVPLGPDLPSGNYKILVIDDHAEEYWSYYFNLLINKLNESQIDIVYSVDGRKTKDGSDVRVMLPDFDLVFLDVVLGKNKESENKESGIEILNDIREALPTLPVVIASTKHDPNLADQLQRANAFIYKKKLHWEQFVDLVARLLREGHGRKKQSLPNPFFNDNIIKNREDVLNFTNWAFKHLDGFHGVDNNYFRYFNDHGGRHMTSLMSILERMIRPFLLSDKGVLYDPKNEKKKEQLDESILCLYLAVLTHEFGMFPMRTDKVKKAITVGFDKEKNKPVMIEDYSSSAFRTPLVFKFNKEKDPDATFGMVTLIIRKFHGPRSMFMLLNPQLQYPEFEKLFNEICKSDLCKSDPTPLCAKIATIVGYHNRFMSLEDESFLDTVGPKKNLLDEIENTSIAEQINKKNFECAFERIKSVVSDKNEKERLRKLCAIFRFADALDIDYSRAIPGYLGYNDENQYPWKNKGYIEDLKRYIVKRVEIDCGKITIHFNLEETSFTKNVFAVTGETLGKLQEERKGAKEKLVREDGEENIADILLNAEKKGDIKRRRELYEDVLSMLFEEKLKEYCTRNDKYEDLEPEIKSLLCGMVILELYDEYQAIETVGLDQIIQFGDVKFGTPVIDCSLLEQMRDRYRS